MDDVRTAVERCGAAAGLLTTSADEVATSAEVRMNRIGDFELALSRILQLNIN